MYKINVYTVSYQKYTYIYIQYTIKIYTYMQAYNHTIFWMNPQYYRQLCSLSSNFVIYFQSDATNAMSKMQPKGQNPNLWPTCSLVESKNYHWCSYFLSWIWKGDDLPNVGHGWNIWFLVYRYGRDKLVKSSQKLEVECVLIDRFTGWSCGKCKIRRK